MRAAIKLLMMDVAELKELNERFAVWVVDHVGTMGCAYMFAALALLALPDNVHDAVDRGFHPAPLIAWISQSFLQLVLLAIIMVGQNVKSRQLQDHTQMLHGTVHDRINALHDHHKKLHERLDDHRDMMQELLDLHKGDTEDGTSTDRPR